MFTDPEEARSDLFLAGAVYLFGPLLLGLIAPVFDLAFIGGLLAVAAQLATTALVPLLLIRYREERWSDYGLDADRGSGLRLGSLLALPLMAAVAVTVFFGTALLGPTLPALVLGQAGLTGFLVNLANWVGLTVLAVYATVKARDAFRADYRAVPDVVTEIGRVLAIAGGVAAVLALTSLQASPVFLIALPLGAAASVLLLLRDLKRPGTTSRAALLAPTILLALRPFNPFALLFNPGSFIISVWLAAIVATVGLLIGAIIEGRRNAWAPAALGLLLGLFVPALAT